MKFRTLTLLLSMGLLSGLSACSTSQKAEADEPTEQVKQAQTQQQANTHAAHHPEGQETEPHHHHGDKHEMMAETCPMNVEGTTRQVSKLDDAVAMDFTTTGDVEELRQRVQKMHGKMHAKEDMMNGGQGKMQHGQMTEDQRQMRQQMKQMMSDVTTTTAEIDGGIRMMFSPKDSAQTDPLYQMMQKHSQMMEENGMCPMMMGGAE